MIPVDILMIFEKTNFKLKRFLELALNFSYVT